MTKMVIDPRTNEEIAVPADTIVRTSKGKHYLLTAAEEDARSAEHEQFLAEEAKIGYNRRRVKEYGSIQDQLDMLYWDKKHGTNKWMEHIDDVKQRYPKPKN